MAVHHFIAVVVCLGRLGTAVPSSEIDSESAGATARTSGGRLIGRQLPANSGGVAVSEFLGVPFATARRFAPPEDFTGRYTSQPLQAQMWGPACLQVGTPPEATYGSEDCLMANVWKPTGVEPGANLPVMVWIFGGSNQFGEAEPYNMSALAAFHDVICVSFNYRTGPLGWMAFHEDVMEKQSTGNWGILDIQSALRWVQREVHFFGGSPDHVAILGQSSGGGLVELQYVAPMSKGLFRGAISESGGLSAQALQAALGNSVSIAKQFGCLDTSKRESWVDKACMSKVPLEKIVGTTYTGSWGPTVDLVTFPMPPPQLLRLGLVNDATVVLGAQTNDSNLFLFREFTKDGLDQPNDRPDGALREMPVVEYVGVLAGLVGMTNLKAALELYPPNNKDLIQNVHMVGNAQSDRAHCQTRERATLFNSAQPGKAFTYRFDYWYTSDAACTAVPNFHLPYLGAAHQDEVTFVLGQPNFMEDGSCCGVWGLTTKDCPHLDRCEACYNPKKSGRTGYRAYFNDKEWAFTRMVGSFWTNVAASGNPNCREAPCSDSEGVWPHHPGGKAVVKNIVLNASLPHGHMAEYTPYDDHRICDFWDSLSKESGNEDESDGDSSTFEVFAV
mmetsp:Transcript_15658/g.36682  ORF Transcript_15658/g.36682 Transcript_15658/m.36682 type:complete len:616 (-) Transcript_15658:39-1886(-)